MTEHGRQMGDELNLVLPGRNYGWPVIGYGVNYGPGRDPIHESAQRAGMEQPVRHRWVPSIATSGLMIYSGDRFPQWRGKRCSWEAWSRQHIARLTMEGQRVASAETILEEPLGRVRDIRQGPDGMRSTSSPTIATASRRPSSEWNRSSGRRLSNQHLSC